MKDKRFDLTLFGEGEGTGEGAVGAAEQNSPMSVPTETAPENTEGSENNSGAERALPLADVGEKIDAVKRIAFLLGLEGKDEASIIEELNARRAKNLLLERLKSRNAKREYAKILSDAEALSEKIKGFDLKREIADRRFTAMLRAGLTCEEAYRAVHAEELISEAKREAEQNAVAAAIEKIQLSMARPYENGGAGTSPAQSQQGVENLSGKGIREILRRVENGAKIKF